LKKYLILSALLATIVLLCTGCLGTGGSGSPQSTEAPVVYNSVDEFKSGIATIKGSDGEDTHALKTMDSYYVPTELPQDAKLVTIKAASFYVRVQYSFGTVDPKSYENQYELVWYRNNNGTDYMNKLANDGNTYDQIKGANDVTYMVTKAKVRSETDENATVDFCQIVYWAQESQAFMAAVPLTFTHDDIVKYCVAEKAVIS
jgi:hypothetical protein